MIEQFGAASTYLVPVGRCVMARELPQCRKVQVSLSQKWPQYGVTTPLKTEVRWPLGTKEAILLRQEFNA